MKNLVWGKILTAAFFVTVLSVVVYKAIYLPITHDEKSAAVYYAWWGTGQILMGDIWPSNHILNTLLIKVSEALFGPEVWAVRLPNVLAFVLFFAVMYAVAKKYFAQWPLLFCLPIVIMFCNPFLLDFFGLARGYGLSNALMACSAFFLLLFADNKRMKHYYLAIVFAMLAAHANFTLLIYWVAVHLLLVALFIIDARATKQPNKAIAKHLLYTIVIATAYMALCYVPLYKMHSTNQFIYWAKDGFYKNTLLDAIDNFRYGQRYFGVTNHLFATAVLIICGIAGMYSVIKVVHSRGALSNPLVVVLFLLLLVWFVNMLQSILLGTPFLTTRTALSYHVLFALVLIFGLREIMLNSGRVGELFAAIVSVLFVFHLTQTTSLTYVREWKYDADTYKVLNYLQAYRRENSDLDKIDLNTNWLYHPSFSFYSITDKTPWLNLVEYHKETDTASNTLFYYALRDEAPQLTNYTPVLEFPDNIGVLLKRK